MSNPPANLTYIRHRVRKGIPNVARAWENFTEQIERACNELEGYRKGEDLEDIGCVCSVGQAIQSHPTDCQRIYIVKAEGRA